MKRIEWPAVLRSELPSGIPLKYQESKMDSNRRSPVEGTLDVCRTRDQL